MNKKELHLEDLGYSIRYWLDNNHVMSFEVFSIYGRVANVKGKKVNFLSYGRKGADNGLDTVKDLDEAQIFVSGSIKWDGCSNIKFDEQEECMLHFCGKKSATDVGALLGKLYDLALEYIPRSDESLF